MTKVECPGPGFKGLKWKWIQDHAKEQQEREKERLTTQQAQPPGATQPHCLQQQPVPNNSSSEPPQTADASEGHASASRQSNSGWGLPQQPSGHAVLSHPAVKVEGANGSSGTSTSPRASMTGDVLHTSSDERVRVKEEQEGKALGAEPPAATASHAPTGRLDVGVVPLSHSTVPVTGTAGASAGPSGGTSTAAATGPGFSLTGSGVSPTPTMPAAGLLRRKSTDVAASIPAASVSLSPAALTSPSPALPGPADASHGTAASAAAATIQVVPQTAAAAASPSCVLSPPSAPAPSTFAAAAQPASATPAAQPPGPGPSSAPPFASGAARVRLPPARGPSMNVAPVSAKGGDDFESMFTPLLSIPSVKSETPRAGIASRSSSLLPGPQASLPNTTSGGGAAGAAASVQLDAVVERKGLVKKASRVQDGRSNAGQLSTAATGASEQVDGEHGPSARSRTPVAQANTAAAAAPAGAGKEAAASATVAVPPASGKAQPQGQTASQPHAQSQPAQQQQQPPPPVAQQQLQQRVSGPKHARDGSKPRDSGEGTAPAGAAIGGEAVAPVVGPSLASSRGGAGGDRAGAPASAGSTPAAAAAHSGGEAGERKRPRSEGSKPKGGISLTADPLTDTGWPYCETLADRIKRAKRATTSSSDQEGPHSHGGSAERHAGHAAANAGNAATGDGQANTAGAGARGAGEQPPRPTVSAEAQSRGAEAAAPGTNPARGLQTAASGGAAAAGAGGANAKQQRQQPPAQGRGKPFGRSEDPMAIPPALFPRSGMPTAEKSLDQQAQNPVSLRSSGGGAVTDSSGGPQRASGPPPAGKGAAAGQGGSGAAAGVGGKRAAPEAPPSSRRHNGPPAKFPRSDPHLPRPHQPHAQDRRDSAAVAAAAGSGRGASALPPPPASKLVHRASSGPPAGRTDGGPGPSDGQGPPTSGTAPGQAPAPVGPLPPGRPGRLGESDTPAAGSCKGPVVAGSRGSKDGAGDKGACGPRHAGGQLDAACGGAGVGAGGAGAAATTTTDPKTDSDTRTSRVVECFFEFDLPCRAAGGSASISGLGSSGSLQGGHGLAARLGGGSRFFGGGPTAATLLPRGVGAGGGGGGATAAAQFLDLGKVRSFKELWTQLAALYDGVLPDEMDSKLIYLDEEGDWIMVTPDEPWSSVAAAATKVLVTNRT
ncbi:hypothetical protein PLESTB_000163100 [Pleodorina starrii]|uniref:PB1 domain-containing protein n=1 Tax=Pleodorina starrii TaxID=330485 RepID=A0A9W6BBX0_9CHLO|nr:hypothetical protein PLESTM_000461400 [Pleodorina starrii]GLC48920.1 hypothetical protein PLESTB_000163100 [Pleodorina starrii]GLC72649.1 hypothetical protein PLESTF_001274500 [Pleodorina starrii]